MSNPTFGAARKTDHLVSRAKELSQIQKAIYSPGTETRLLVIEAEGGMGKTRLLQEVLNRTGHPNAPYPLKDSKKKWDSTDHIIVTDLLDLANVQLYTFHHFIWALRDAFSWHKAARFANFDRARAYHQRKLYEQADFATIQQAEEQAENSFFKDYQAMASQYRLVWLLDTAEQLNFIGAPWLLSEGLLTFDDLSFSTQQRLAQLLAQGKLPNTTIILAGRGQRAKLYFDRLKSKENEAGCAYQITSIPLENFNRQETKEYLVELAKNWSQQEPASQMAAYLKLMAHAEDQADVLWLYTGGQPVRLALYIDVLAEGKKVPEALQVSFADAKTEVNWDEAADQADKDKLQEIQFQIEDEFINLIFDRAGELRSQILRILAQARRGLDEHQLHFILDAPPGINVESWEEDSARLKEIRDELKSMIGLSFIKTTPAGQLILQDEMYYIYDKHAAADETTRQDESQSRQTIYYQLLSLVNAEIKQLTEQIKGYRQADERSLRWETPAQALSMHFGFVTETELKARSDLNERQFQAQVEKLFYELRINPHEAFNSTFDNLIQSRTFKNIEGDAQLLNETWRILNDELAHQFIRLSPLEETVEQPELWAGLERAAQQEGVARWIKRFMFSKQYRRAIKFAEQVEAFINTLPREGRGTLGWTLGHTFSKGERTCWREFARLTIGQDRQGAISRLEEAALDLQRLLTPQGIPERQEKNFLEHPAQIRLRQVIGAIYNNLGIGYAGQGQFRKAAKVYAEALRYFREAEFEGQLAITLNNLSRVLSELGRQTRAVRVCQDGLNHRGGETGLAYSYNTLALIYNKNLQPDNAWPEATKAVVYFRRLEDPRGLGLSLLQLGEALRRLAFSSHPSVRSREELLNVAEDATLEALDIFTNTPNVSAEVMRRIEVEIELGCLYRDYMHYVKSLSDSHPDQETRWRRFRDKALQYLDEAITLAEIHQYPRHLLDAQVNLVWTNYYADDADQAEAICNRILSGLADKPFLIHKNQSPPMPQKIDETYIFLQLGKLWAVKGRIAFDRFQARVQVIEQESLNKAAVYEKVQIDAEANQSLQAAAEAFVLSLGYAQLFSARSSGIGIVFDQLYNYLKKFNIVEMELFYKYQHQARQDYRVTGIKPENLADVEEFLLESFGDYLPEDVKQEVR
jgi:hypothetical protein